MNNYLSWGNYEDALNHWLRTPVAPADPLDPPEVGLELELETLLEDLQGEEGIVA